MPRAVTSRVVMPRAVMPRAAMSRAGVYITVTTGAVMTRASNDRRWKITSFVSWYTPLSLSIWSHILQLHLISANGRATGNHPPGMQPGWLIEMEIVAIKVCLVSADDMWNAHNVYYLHVIRMFFQAGFDVGILRKKVEFVASNIIIWAKFLLIVL